MTLRALGDVALLAWAVPAILAPILYLDVRDPDTGGRFGFRRTELGWHLQAYMAALALMALLGVCRLVFGDGPGWAAARVVVFVCCVIPVTWWRLAVVEQSRRDSRRELAERERTEDPPGTAPGP